MKSNWLKLQLPALCLIAPIQIGLLSVTLYAQRNDERTVSANDVEQITDPVLISKITVGGKPIECELFVAPSVVQSVVPFRADGDWLRQMTISAVNRTDKVIVYATFVLRFLDTGDCNALPCAKANLVLGHRHPLDSFDGRNGQPLKREHLGKADLKWLPQQTIVIRVDDYMNEIEESVSGLMPLSAISHVRVYRQIFHFDDGMIWGLGRYGVPDPAHPGRTKELPRNYFPGNRGNNWPPGYNY